MNTNIVTLPIIFRPKKIDQLIRLGKESDGGYLVNRDDIFESDVLLSFGISDDWSFEYDFYKLNDLDIYAFDGSLTSIFWIKKNISYIRNLKFSHLLKYFQFRYFSKKNKFFKKKFLSSINDNNNINLENIKNLILDKNIFLKIDIEGHEYRILDDILKIQNNIIGLAIEFHDVDLHLNRIEDFIKKFKLKIIHVHINNYSFDHLKIPNLIELTFSKNYKKEENNFPKHKKDRPNNTYSKDYDIKFNS